jgi:hypothetical protein
LYIAYPAQIAQIGQKPAPFDGIVHRLVRQKQFHLTTSSAAKMLYLPVKVLADATAVSHRIVNRWVQSGWLRGVNRGGRLLFIEFDSLPRLIEGRPHLGVDLEALRALAIEQDAEPDATP